MGSAGSRGMDKRGEIVLKHGKRPTRAQKQRLKSLGLNPDNWLIVKDCPECFVVENRISCKTRTLNLSANKRGA